LIEKSSREIVNVPHTAKIADRHEATKRRKIGVAGDGVQFIVGHFIVNVYNITNKTSVCFIRLSKQHKHAKNLLKKN